ncbi:hypothetical protein NDU88_006578 [Pleurodeles waltl]|uniref:Uncharacterized protein n=1 Tax=Pleurodeles waltl TaxID=8319 RepID=A0AAV7RQM7_PLEWA|nr:hypothetical protein NDU88_006578 [Pleurodeles waltl]
MGDCQTPNQNAREGALPTRQPSAEREPEEEEPLSEQALAQASQAQLEGRDSIVHFLRRKATGSPKWGRKEGGSTIDYIYLSEKLKQSVSHFQITERVESDHNPLKCTIELQAQAAEQQMVQITERVESDHNPLKCTIELQAQAAEQQMVVRVSTGTEQVHLVKRIKRRPEDASKITLWLSAQPQAPTTSPEWWIKVVDDLHKLLLCNLGHTHATLPAQGGTITHMDNTLLGKRRELCRALRRHKQKPKPDTPVQVSNSRTSLKKLVWKHKGEKDRKE